MNIQVRTDGSIEGNARLAHHVEEVVRQGLARFERRISDIEAHVGEQKVTKGADETHCILEVRVQGRHSTVVTAWGSDVHSAVHNAAEKAKHALDSSLGRMGARH